MRATGLDRDSNDVAPAAQPANPFGCIIEVQRAPHQEDDVDLAVVVQDFFDLGELDDPIDGKIDAIELPQ